MSSGPHPVVGRGRSLAEPAFPRDDGRPDPDVRAALSRPDLDDRQLARSLRDLRLLTSVVAVLDEVDPAGGDKDSHMAVVSMVNERGERGLLAFTGVDSLASWNPEARPVPAWGREVARAALDDGAAAVVIDVTGPTRRVLTGSALLALADLLDHAVVDTAVRDALATLMSDGSVDIVVEDARAEGGPVDVLVRVSPSVLAEQAARILEVRTDVRDLVPGGLGVAAS